MPFYFYDAVNYICQKEAVQRRRATRVLLNALQSGAISSRAKVWTESLSIYRDNQRILLNGGQYFTASDWDIPDQFWVYAKAEDANRYCEDWYARVETLGLNLSRKWHLALSREDLEANLFWDMEAYLPILNYSALSEEIADGSFIERWNKPKTQNMGRPIKLGTVVFRQRLEDLLCTDNKLFEKFSDRRIWIILDPNEDQLDERSARKIIRNVREFHNCDEYNFPPP